MLEERIRIKVIHLRNERRLTFSMPTSTPFRRIFQEYIQTLVSINYLKVVF